MSAFTTSRGVKRIRRIYEDDITPMKKRCIMREEEEPMVGPFEEEEEPMEAPKTPRRKLVRPFPIYVIPAKRAEDEIEDDDIDVPSGKIRRVKGPLPKRRNDDDVAGTPSNKKKRTRVRLLKPRPQKNPNGAGNAHLYIIPQKRRRYERK